MTPLTVFVWLGSLGTAPPPPLPVIGGEPALEPAYDGVVALYNDATGRRCSGTLIRPDLVLTAGHCFEAVTDVSMLRVAYGPALDEWADVAEYGTHPQMCLTCGRDEYDYGYVQFSAPIDHPTIAILTDQELWDATMEKGSVVTVVGIGDVPDRAGRPGARWRVDVPIRGFTESGLEFVAGGDGLDSCQGDSGGPALVEALDGSWRLAGVVARGSKECGAGGYYGVAYRALEWLAETAGEPDLCGDACGDCDCLDTRPILDEGCCSTARPGRTPWWMLALLLLVRRRGR